MAFQRGDIVLVPFPFTDLSSSKTRPAVIVSVEAFEKTIGGITVAMVTSQMCDTLFDCPVEDWQQANLRLPSWVRLKLATLSPSLVRYCPGHLSTGDLTRVDQHLRLALGV